jgi:hypothetical protein
VGSIRNTNNLEGSVEMAKYLVFIEVDSKDYDKIIKKSRKTIEYVEKHPEEFPTQVLAPQRLLGDVPKLTKDLKAISIIETDDLQKYVNRKVRQMPEITTYIVPIVEISKFQDAFLKTRE